MIKHKLNSSGFTPPVDERSQVRFNSLQKQQAGFIPMILTLLAILVAVIVYVYLQVIKSSK